MNLFGSKPKPDPAVQRAQKRQNKAIDDQSAEEAREAGSRRRIMNARKAGGSGLFAQTGAAGVKSTFG